MTRSSNGLSLVACITCVAGVACVFLGCAAREELSPEPPDAGCAEDACVAGPPFDADSVDLGPGSNDDREGLPPDSLGATAARADLESCYDGQDNNHDGVFDCGDPGCETLASCCVGATSLACCAAQPPVTTMALGDCTGPLDGCVGLDGFSSFGSPAPLASTGRLFPNGDDSGDSGIVLSSPLDAQRALVVSGLLATPVGDCGDGCFESIALGLIGSGTPGSVTTLRPLVAVVASAARREIALVLAGDTIGRIPLSTPNEQHISLVVLPTGAVSLEVYDAVTRAPLPALGGRIEPSTADLRLAVYGHNLNRSAAARPASYARDVTVTTALCDVPSRWLDRRALAVGTGAVALGSSSAPSFAYGDGQTFVAFASEGALIFGRADGEDVSAGFALLAANRTFAIFGEVLGDPDVHYDPPVGAAPAGYTVYFANLTRRSIWRLHLALDGTPLGAPAEWIGPALDPGYLESIDGPSVLRPRPALGGPTFVFARIRTLAHETRIVRFELPAETDAFVKPDDWDAVTVRTTQADFGAFDRDEVAGPAAYRQNGSLQVAFAGRSGARWALGLMVTDDPRVLLWRRAPARTILSGDGSGFDALSVRDPAIVARDPEVELLYAGSDGVTETLGYANRVASNAIVGGP